MQAFTFGLLVIISELNDGVTKLLIGFEVHNESRHGVLETGKATLPD